MKGYKGGDHATVVTEAIEEDGGQFIEITYP